MMKSRVNEFTLHVSNSILKITLIKLFVKLCALFEYCIDYKDVNWNDGNINRGFPTFRLLVMNTFWRLFFLFLNFAAP